MPRTISVSLSDEQVDRLERAVAEGRFENVDAALQEGVARALAEPADSEIAKAYRQAYTAHPQDRSIGTAGAALAAELVEAAERDVR